MAYRTRKYASRRKARRGGRTRRCRRGGLVDGAYDRPKFN
jgi:hypothetical protein